MASSSKRQQTMAKRNREQALRDKRAHKAEKKQARQDAAAAALNAPEGDEMLLEGEDGDLDETGEAETSDVEAPLVTDEARQPERAST